MGEQSVARDDSELRHVDVVRRRDAAHRLALADSVPRSSVLGLVDAASDSDDEGRNWVAEALERMGPTDVADVRQLADRLKLPGPDSAYWAATLLGRLGPEAAPAVTSLVQVLEHRSELAVRERAVWAIGQMGESAQDAISSLQ